jgi:hypothetical protein
VTVQSGRCVACGLDAHGDGVCPPRLLAEIEVIASGPCNCLPEAQLDWQTCATCGLPQAPGKAWCGFCGSRWVSEPTG